MRRLSSEVCLLATGMAGAHGCSLGVMLKGSKDAVGHSTLRCKHW